MKRILLALGLVFAAVCVSAQEAPKKPSPPSPEEMRQMMDASMGAMVPMMGKMAEVSIEAQLSVAEKPDTARRIAQFKKNLYDSLLKEGFSKAQAFSIVLSTPIPSPVGGLKQ